MTNYLERDGANICVWWQNTSLKWCVARASADSWADVSTHHYGKEDAQAYVLDHFEETSEAREANAVSNVRFFDGLPDDLDPDTWDA